MTRQSRKSKLDEMFIRADKMWHRGQLRNAFRLFLVAANAGDKASQLNVGYFYDNGVGTKRNREEALRWYKRWPHFTQFYVCCNPDPGV